MGNLVLVLEEGPTWPRQQFAIPDNAVVLMGRSRAALVKLPDADLRVSGKHALVFSRADTLCVAVLGGHTVTIDGGATTWGVLPRGGVMHVCDYQFHLEAEGEIECAIELSDVDLESITTELSAADLEVLSSRIEAPKPGAPAPPRVPRRFGDFDVLEEVGRGGFGAVHRAHHRTSGKACALKLLVPKTAANAAPIRRFLREQQVLFGLDHPNIAAFVAAGEHQGVHYLAMEYVAGGAVEARRPYDNHPAQEARVARELFGALAYLHAKRITHRDLKPANVLFTAPDTSGNRNIKLVDFGFGKAFDANQHTALVPALTQQGQFGGTLRWAAPEQIHDFTNYHPSADLYSAAAVLYYVFTGESHLVDDPSLSDNPAARHYHMATAGDRVPLALRRPDLRGRRAEILDGLLAVDPTARMATSAEALASEWG